MNFSNHQPYRLGMLAISMVLFLIGADIVSAQPVPFRTEQIALNDGNGNIVTIKTETGPITGGTLVLPDPDGAICTLVAADAAGQVLINGTLRGNGSTLKVNDDVTVSGTLSINDDGNGLGSVDNLHISEESISYNSPTAQTLTIENSGIGGLAVQLNGNLTVTGTLSAPSISVGGTIPIGGIIMWSGSVASIPAGWALCNGTLGTPDLRGRFIVGAVSDIDATYAPGNTGGTASNNTAHTHDFAHTHTGTTSSDGAHTHNLATTGTVQNVKYAGGSGTPDNDLSYTVASSSGAHTHTTSTTTQSTSTTSSAGTTIDNRPPYYTLAYIMRVL